MHSDKHDDAHQSDKLPLVHTSAFSLRKSFLPRKVRSKRTFSFFPLTVHRPFPPPSPPPATSICSTFPPLPPPMWTNPALSQSYTSSDNVEGLQPLVVTKLQTTTLMTTIDFIDIKKESTSDDMYVHIPSIPASCSELEQNRYHTVKIPPHFSSSATSIQEKRAVALPREAKVSSRKRNTSSSHLPLSTLLIEGPYHFSLRLTESSYQYNSDPFCYRTSSEIILPSPARIKEAELCRKVKRKATVSLIDLSELSYQKSRRKRHRTTMDPKNAKRIAGRFYHKGQQPLFPSHPMYNRQRVYSNYDSALSSSDGEATLPYYDEPVQYHSSSEVIFKGYFNSLYEMQPLHCKRSAKRKVRYKRERVQKVNPFPDLVIAGSQFESLQQQLSSVMTDLIDTTLNQVGEMIRDKERKQMKMITTALFVSFPR